MDKVGVFYATREGHSRKVAEHVAAALLARGLEVEVHGVKDENAVVALDASDAAVLIGSVHSGKHEPELIDFVRHHREQLESMPAAFVSVCGAEAAVENLSAPPEVRAKAATQVVAQLATFSAATGWHPAHVRPVAGAFLYTHYNPLVRWVMKRIAKSEALPTDTSRDHELTDWVTLDHFAHSFAAELTHASP